MRNPVPNSTLVSHMTTSAVVTLVKYDLWVPDRKPDSTTRSACLDEGSQYKSDCIEPNVPPLLWCGSLERRVAAQMSLSSLDRDLPEMGCSKTGHINITKLTTTRSLNTKTHLLWKWIQKILG
ncbi:hypothetical protein AVEN_225807-1 [Araneus ventricosus]|uniref:Uncharacterized protein n=1 Tax=Araneus ventricosus TaxID=182803 RepID=A0A4Y2BB40_ARAVE|nr:hypothetical protein AVEN_225807-1 [Araneus ventricosus]